MTSPVTTVLCVLFAVMVVTSPAVDAVKVCETDSDYTPDAPTNYGCEATGLVRSKCEAAGGEYKEKEGNKCEVDVNNIPNASDRKAKCDKIGGTVSETSCKTLVTYGYAPDITDKGQCDDLHPVTRQPNSFALKYIGSKCCGGNAYNPICGGPPKVCEVDSDYTPDAPMSYGCEVKGLERSKCEAAGGEYKEKEGNKCEVDVNNIPNASDRKAKCDKIGGTVSETSCNAALSHGYVNFVTDKDQCDAVNTLSGQTNAVGMKYVGSKCCGGNAYNPICGGPPKVCEVDSDYTPDAVASYGCEVKGLERSKCEAAGAEYKDEDGGKCEMYVDGMANAHDRKKKCDKIGGLVSQTSCNTMVSYGYVQAVTDKGQCDAVNPLTKQPNSFGLSYVGSRCCGGNAYNQVCGGPTKMCDLNSDFQPDASSNFPSDPGQSSPTCDQVRSYLTGSIVPASSSECNDDVPQLPNVKKGGLFAFLGLHCCSSPGRQGIGIKTCPKPASVCKAGWDDFNDDIYRYSCTGIPAQDEKACTSLGGFWHSDDSKCEQDDSTESVCSKAGGTLVPVRCSQDFMLYGVDVGPGSEAQCKEKPFNTSQYGLSYYVKKMASKCCNTNAAAICDGNIAISTTKFNAGASGAATTKAASNATTTKADTSNGTTAKADANLSTSTVPPTETVSLVSLDAAAKAKADADKAYKDAGCESDSQKKGCAELAQRVETATAELQRAKDADAAAESIAFTASSCHAFVLCAAAAAVSLF